MKGSQRTKIAIAVAGALILAAGGLYSSNRLRKTTPEPSQSTISPEPSTSLVVSGGNLSESSSSTGVTTSSSPGWITFRNKYGYSLQYPSSWEINGNDGNPSEEDAAPYLQGPTGCYVSQQECGYFSISIWLGSILPNPKAAALSALSAKDFLLATQFPTPPDPNRLLLSQGETSIGGQSAYYIVFRQTNFEDYPNGVIMEDIEVKSLGKFYQIALYETGENRSSIASIQTPGGWSLNPVFQKIVSTIQFSGF